MDETKDRQIFVSVATVTDNFQTCYHNMGFLSLKGRVGHFVTLQTLATEPP